MIRLPAINPILMRFAKFGFPIFDPIIEIDFHFARRSKEMNMIGHDDIPASKPSRGFCQVLCNR